VLQNASFPTMTVESLALTSFDGSDPQQLARSTQLWVAASLIPTRHCAICAEQAFSLQLLADWRQSLQADDMLGMHAETQALLLQSQDAVHATKAEHGPPLA
jgi:hypothetical protein